MLNRTFIHIPGVGPTTERRLWDAGIITWQDALGLEHRPLSFSDERWRLVQDTLHSSNQSLRAGDHRYFARLLAKRDHWRAYPDFNRRVAYLDIETTGCGSWAQVTVIGVHDGMRTVQYVAQDNMDDFATDIAQYSLIVTFNGATFDLPFILRQFPGLELQHLHVDLRYLLAGLGYKGGLKAIEPRLGITRGDEINGLDGWDAVRLWNEYRRGSDASLELLLQYNRADVENLAVLMELAYGQAWGEVGGG